MRCNQVHQQAWLSKIVAACGGSPLLLQLSGTALTNDMMPAKMVHTALTCPEDGRTALEACVPPLFALCEYEFNSQSVFRRSVLAAVYHPRVL